PRPPASPLFPYTSLFRSLLEPGPERRGDAIPVGGRVLERRFDQPRRAVLELGSDAHHLHPPADATWMLECALEQLVQRMREQLALGDREKNVIAAVIGSGAARPTTRSTVAPAASRHRRRPAVPNRETSASS